MMPPRAVAGIGALVAISVGALGASYLAPNDPAAQFRGHLLAPPMPVHVRDDSGAFRAPFVYPIRVVDRLERRFAEDRARPVPVRLFHRGRLVALDSDALGPWLPLGADHLGRDVFARALHGARISLAVAAAAVAGAVLLGLVLGAAAGYGRGWVDDVLMRAAELVLVLPVLYVLLAVRATLPLAVEPWQVFVLIVACLVALGWPTVARGVRGIVSTEASRDYVAAPIL
jgi:peptide/nickel transport system permease protein